VRARACVCVLLCVLTGMVPQADRDKRTQAHRHRGTQRHAEAHREENSALPAAAAAAAATSAHLCHPRAAALLCGAAVGVQVEVGARRAALRQGQRVVRGVVVFEACVARVSAQPRPSECSKCCTVRPVVRVTRRAQRRRRHSARSSPA
jgi:hypothetical protein